MPTFDSLFQLMPTFDSLFQLLPIFAPNYIMISYAGKGLQTIIKSMCRENS